MVNLQSFLESGLLESYVMGCSSQQETELVQQMAATYIEVQEELDEIQESLEMLAKASALLPDPVVKPFLMATIDYTERLTNGEQPAFPPELTDGSSPKDYEEWLQRKDLQAPVFFNDIHAKIIGYTPAAITAIVWIKAMAPQEVHDHEHERFLVLEGTCDIHVEKSVYPLVAGDYFAIPLHKDHQVVVTSSIPCKVILQRIAA